MPKIEIQFPEPNGTLARALGEQLHHLMARVRHRAYELGQQRQGTQDADLEDWLRAEAELLFPAQFEVKQDPDSYQLFIYLPGCAAQNFHVYAFEGGLVLTGQISGQCSEADREKTTRSAFYWWPLPTGAHLPGVTAELKHNRLGIKIPIREAAQLVATGTRSRGLTESQQGATD